MEITLRPQYCILRSKHSYQYLKSTRLSRAALNSIQLTILKLSPNHKNMEWKKGKAEDEKDSDGG